VKHNGCKYIGVSATWFAADMLAELTSQASLDEKHLWFSTQAFAVDIIEILNNIQNADWLSVTGVQDSKFAVCKDAADKCVKVGMVNGRHSQKQLLKSIHWQVIVNFNLKLQLRKYVF